MITTVRNALSELGYKVHSTRQEKIGTNELVVVMFDVSVQPLEIADHYIASVWILIEWDTMSPDDIPTQIASLVSKLEHKVADKTQVPCKATFKIIQSDVNQLGLMYRVSITLEYLEEINLD